LHVKSIIKTEVAENSNNSNDSIKKLDFCRISILPPLKVKNCNVKKESKCTTILDFDEVNLNEQLNTDMNKFLKSVNNIFKPNETMLDIKSEDITNNDKCFLKKKTIETQANEINM